MSEHPDNLIADYPYESVLELTKSIPKSNPFPPFDCYEMVQCGYPRPDHGEMVWRTDSGTNVNGELLPPNGAAMWVKRTDAENALTTALARAESAERRNADLEHRLTSFGDGQSIHLNTRIQSLETRNRQLVQAMGKAVKELAKWDGMLEYAATTPTPASTRNTIGDVRFKLKQALALLKEEMGREG